MRRFVGFSAAREMVSATVAAQITATKENVVSFSDYLPRVQITIPALEIRKAAARAREEMESGATKMVQNVQSAKNSAVKHGPRMANAAGRAAWKALCWTTKAFACSLIATAKARQAQATYHAVVGNGELRDLLGQGIHDGVQKGEFKRLCAEWGI